MAPSDSAGERLTNRVWEDLEPGTLYGPYPDRATVGDCERWARVYDQDAPSDRRVPPGLMPVYALHALRAAFQGIPPGGVLARQTFRFAHPLELEQSFTVTIQIAEKYLRRERPYVVLHYEMRLGDGTLACESAQTLIWPRRESPPTEPGEATRAS